MSFNQTFGTMTTRITSPGNTANQDAITTELEKIMRQLGVKPQQELNRPFASWEEMQRWNRERHGQNMPLSRALDEFRGTLEHTHTRLQQVQAHYESRQAQTERKQMRFAARCLAGVMLTSLLMSLLMLGIG